MTKEQLEHYKKIIAQRRMEEAKVMEDKAVEDMLKRGEVEKPSPKRDVTFEGKKGAIEVYEDWLKRYKKKNPDFKEDENTFKMDGNGNGILNFSDPQAEEDFVRHLASNQSHGEILDKGIIIAKFEDGKLVDPRTNQEFPEGEYANLVQKLDSGMDYNDIPSPKSTAPTPFSMSPY